MTEARDPTRSADVATLKILGQLRGILRKHYGRVVDLFRSWDVDSSGNIGKHEVRRALLKIGYDPSRAQLDALWRALDKDGSGSVQYRELYDVLRHADEPTNASEAEPPPAPPAPPAATGPRAAAREVPSQEDQDRRVRSSVEPCAARLTDALQRAVRQYRSPGASVSAEAILHDMSHMLNPGLASELRSLFTAISHAGEEVLLSEALEQHELTQLLALRPTATPEPSDSYVVCECVRS